MKCSQVGQVYLTIYPSTTIADDFLVDLKKKIFDTGI